MTEAEQFEEEIKSRGEELKVLATATEIVVEKRECGLHEFLLLCNGSCQSTNAMLVCRLFACFKE